MFFFFSLKTYIIPLIESNWCKFNVLFIAVDYEIAFLEKQILPNDVKPFFLNGSYTCSRYLTFSYYTPKTLKLFRH